MFPMVLCTPQWVGAAPPQPVSPPVPSLELSGLTTPSNTTISCIQSTPGSGPFAGGSLPENHHWPGKWQKSLGGAERGGSGMGSPGSWGSGGHRLS